MDVKDLIPQFIAVAESALPPPWRAPFVIISALVFLLAPQALAACRALRVGTSSPLAPTSKRRTTTTIKITRVTEEGGP